MSPIGTAAAIAILAMVLIAVGSLVVEAVRGRGAPERPGLLDDEHRRAA